MPTVCIERPNRRQPRVYSARDVGRILAHAREDGASDTLLLAYVLDGFGLRRTVCIITEILGVLNQAVLLGAIITGLNGLASLLKGLKLVLTARRATIPGIIELLIPKKWIPGLGQALVALGVLQIVAAGSVAFVSALANNVELLLLMQGTCRAELRPVNPNPVPLNLGGLDEAFDALSSIMRIASEEAR